MCRASLHAKKIIDAKLGVNVQSSVKGPYRQPILYQKNKRGRIKKKSCAVCWKSGDVMLLTLPVAIQSEMNLPSPLLTMFFDIDGENGYADDSIAFVRQDIDIPEDLSQLKRSHFSKATSFKVFIKRTHARGSAITGTVVSCASERVEQDYPLEVTQSETVMEEFIRDLNEMSSVPHGLVRIDETHVETVPELEQVA